MGTIRFALRLDKPDRSGLLPLQLIYHIDGERIRHQLKEKLRKENWNQDSQTAVFIDKKQAKQLLPNVDFGLLPTNKEIESFNGDLISIKKQIQDIEKLFTFNQEEYSPKMVIDAFVNRKIKTKATSKNNSLIEFIDKYVEDNKASRVKGSLSVYKSVKSHLEGFQITKRKKVTFESIDFAFFSEFQNYLLSLKIDIKTSQGINQVPRLNNITIAKQLTTIKTLLNYAKKHGHSVAGNYSDFKIKKEQLEVIALTNSEFESLYFLDLNGNKKLDQVRDVFCFSCSTGFRYSDLFQLKREHIKNDEIRLVVQKTKEPLIVPLNNYSHKILEKYNEFNKPLPVISNQKTNSYLKELCKLAGIDEQIQIIRFRGAKREETTYLKHELISCHSGRKTFATLSLEKGMSAEEVMKIGGWKDYKSFKRYVNITAERSKIVMRNAWGEIKRPILKAV